MSGFSKGWQKKEDKGGGRGLGSFLRNPPPVKPQIDQASKEIAILISRLGQAEARIKQRDEAIFQRVVSAVKNGDRDHASIYANELSHFRKLGTTVTGAKLALEQVALRLGTITDLGDVVATLGPTIAVVKGVGQGLGSVLPNAQGELDQISTLLSSTLVEAGTVGGTTLNFQAANSEAEEVLQEAAAVADQRMSEQFPEVPSAPPQDESEEEGMAI
jgi:division protein CdvB (Snf7/Vps24/ESCRT-III family)